jgi:uncharacterized protein YdeI (YjbR/CyaY-like superfamily)
MQWRAWLDENHAGEKEAWLVIQKHHVARAGVSYEEAVEEALCFGWIDGRMKSVDADTYVLRFSPRKRRSIWSASNQKRVESLIAQGRMTEAGMAKVREAKENGEWEAAIRRENTSSLPDDLRAALAGNASAQANFERLPPSQKKQFLYWISTAKTEETRQRRIRKTIEMAADNQRPGAE